MAVDKRLKIRTRLPPVIVKACGLEIRVLNSLSQNCNFNSWTGQCLALLSKTLPFTFIQFNPLLKNGVILRWDGVPFMLEIYSPWKPENRPFVLPRGQEGNTPLFYEPMTSTHSGSSAYMLFNPGLRLC